MMESARGRFSFTMLMVVVVVLGLAGIISLSLYSYAREDYLYADRDQMHILMNSWYCLEKEMLNLLVDPAAANGDEKWLYSLRTFDKRLDSFLNSSLAQKLARQNRFFGRKANDVTLLWSTLRDTIKDSKSGSQDSRLKTINVTALLEEMSDIVSDRISEETANLRLAVFVLSMAITISIVFFIAQVQRKFHLCQLELEQTISQRTSELEAAKAKAEIARLQTEQINRQLQMSVGHANLMSQQVMEAGRAKSEFLANMSHRIRTPMNAMIGFSEMLVEESLTAQQQKQVKIIQDSSRRLLQLMNDILDFSRIETGMLDVEIADSGVENILATVESIMRPAAAEKGLQFEIIRNEPLPEFIRTDSARLKQCLINLVSNAVKFTDKGHVYLRVGWENRSNRPFIRFDVEDTGIGIAPEQRYRIFEPFYSYSAEAAAKAGQADSDTTRRFGGTGLGLAITQHLAQLLGGSVTVNSTTDKGSVFTLIMPTGVPPAGAVEEDSAVNARQKNRQLPKDTNNLKLSGKVLVAEDSPTNLMLIELLLKKLGLETETVENGEQAVQKAAAEKFDVILMDIQMPVMSGYEATKQIRKQGVKTPVIALTACVMKGDDEKCFAAGCNDYIPKPIDRKKLVETLAKYLSARQEKPSSEVIPTKNSGNRGKIPQQSSAVSVEGGEIEIDWPLLTERVGGEDLIDEIMPIFVRDNTERMQMLSRAVKADDQKEVKFYAHSLKGASATVGAVKISELAKQLENAARDGDSSVFKPVFEEMSKRFSRLMDFLSKSDWKQIAQQASLRQHTERG